MSIEMAVGGVQSRHRKGVCGDACLGMLACLHGVTPAVPNQKGCAGSQAARQKGRPLLCRSFLELMRQVTYGAQQDCNTDTSLSHISVTSHQPARPL